MLVGDGNGAAVALLPSWARALPEKATTIASASADLKANFMIAPLPRYSSATMAD